MTQCEISLGNSSGSRFPCRITSLLTKRLQCFGEFWDHGLQLAAWNSQYWQKHSGWSSK